MRATLYINHTKIAEGDLSDVYPVFAECRDEALMSDITNNEYVTIAKYVILVGDEKVEYKLVVYHCPSFTSLYCPTCRKLITPSKDTLIEADPEKRVTRFCHRWSALWVVDEKTNLASVKKMWRS